MKLFIFGAGASSASQEDIHGNTLPVDISVKAPLVNELFHNRYLKYFQYLGFTPDRFQEFGRAKKPNNSVEQWLTNKWDGIKLLKTSVSVRAERADLGKICFYIWWMLQNVSNYYNGFNLYRKFLTKLRAKDEEFGIISFNYDTLLDRALNDVFGFNPSRIIDYINFPYIKPHGSVNWFIRRKSGDQEISRVEGSMDIHVRINLAASQMFGQTRAIGEPDIWAPLHHQLNEITIIATPGLGGMYAYPLIMLPLTSKLYDFFDGFKKTIIEPARSLVTQAKEIYVIGYRAVDDVIKDILEPVKLDTPFDVVSLDDASTIADNILKWKRELKLRKVYDRGFSDFISFSGF